MIAESHKLCFSQGEDVAQTRLTMYAYGRVACHEKMKSRGCCCAHDVKCFELWTATFQEKDYHPNAALDYGLQPSMTGHHSNTALDHGLQPSKDRSSLEHNDIHACILRSHADTW